MYVYAYICVLCVCRYVYAFMCKYIGIYALIVRVTLCLRERKWVYLLLGSTVIPPLVSHGPRWPRQTDTVIVLHKMMPKTAFIICLTFGRRSPMSLNGE